MSTSDEVTHDEYAVVGAWGQSPYQQLVVPSGQKCLVKKIDMEDLISLDVARDVDTVSGVAAENVAKAQGKAPADRKTKQPTKSEALAIEQAKAADIAKDPDAIKKHVGLIRKIVCFAVQMPKIHPVPTPDPMRRELGKVYVDSIGFKDQMEIFKFAMSATTDAETFREEPAADVGDVENGETLQLPSE